MLPYFTPEVVATLPALTHLRVRVEAGVLWLMLDRPEKKNALNPRMVNELAFVLSHAHHNPKVCAVVLQAEGSVFCAGMDLSQLQTSDETFPKPAQEVRLYELFSGLHKPCIGIVEAQVYAGGILLLAGCTYVLAKPEVTFTLPEVRRGLFPFQVMDALVDIGCSPRKVMDWCVRGRSITAHEALELGLVSEVSDTEIHQKNQAYLTDIQIVSPMAVQAGLAAFQTIKTLPASERQAHLLAAFRAIQDTPDAREGLAAFKEKRLPKW